MSRRQLSKRCSKSSKTITTEAWKWLFLLWKPKRCLDIKLVAFKQFSSNNKQLTMGVFLFRKFSVDFRHFRVFVFCHRAYSKTWKPRKIFRSSFFEVLSTFIWCQALSKAFCVFKKKLSRCCSKLSRSTYYWSLKLTFPIIKAKMVRR